MIIGREYRYDNYDECANVPGQETFRDFVQESREEDIEAQCHEGDSIRNKNGMPSVDYIARIAEVRGSEDEVGCDEVVCSAHCEDSNEHEPAADVAHCSSKLFRSENGNPTVLSS